MLYDKVHINPIHSNFPKTKEEPVVHLIAVGLPTEVIASWFREIDNQYTFISISKERFTFVITLKI